MATKGVKNSSDDGESASLGASSDALLLAALNRGEATWETGRFVVTFKAGATEDGMRELEASGLSVANANDVDFLGVSALTDAPALAFPMLGVAVVAGDAAQASDLTAQSVMASDSAIEVIEPELFVFPADSGVEGYQQGYAATAEGGLNEYLRGFVGAATAIREDLVGGALPTRAEEEPELLLGATWGLTACRVPSSTKSGAETKVAVLDTGFNHPGHPDFPDVRIGGQKSFVVGQEVQDLHSHGTHCIGTACGPQSPPGSTPRYGIAHRCSIFVGKVLSNTGSGTQAQVLAGMNWAIAEGCQVISMSLGSSSPVNTAYTAAGQAALNSGCLIIAAAGNSAPNPTGSPANSPTIMSVASLDKDLRLSSFTQRGKIDVAAPGRDVSSSVPMPGRYGTKSGTSMATPHVAGCAALWAQTSPNLRGLNLWRKLQETARPLPFPATQVGAGLVQAPP
jgi:subtilisin family serine protease